MSLLSTLAVTCYQMLVQRPCWLSVYDVSVTSGLRPADLEQPNLSATLQLLTNPSAQIQELQQALTALSGQTANSQACPILTIVVNTTVVCFEMY